LAYTQVQMLQKDLVVGATVDTPDS
jgi:hypothetical protein